MLRLESFSRLRESNNIVWVNPVVDGENYNDHNLIIRNEIYTIL